MWGGLKVRIGISSGEALVDSTMSLSKSKTYIPKVRYFGNAVNTSAIIENRCFGGQIAVAENVFEELSLYLEIQKLDQKGGLHLFAEKKADPNIVKNLFMINPKAKTFAAKLGFIDSTPYYQIIPSLIASRKFPMQKVKNLTKSTTEDSFNLNLREIFSRKGKIAAESMPGFEMTKQKTFDYQNQIEKTSANITILKNIKEVFGKLAI